jgi:putative transposase
VQIDHTPVDVIVVDERERLPIGRPWLTLAIDVASRVVLGFSVSLDPPSTVSVALALTHAALRKDLWLADRELQAPWPMYGLPECLHLDNAREFHSKALARGGQEYGIKIDFRPPGTPHYGGHVERLIGTTMGAVHLLPGTTFSNVAEKGEYDSAKTSALTLLELERWLALQITGIYHNSIHSALLKPPLAAWNQGTLGIKVREPIDANAFFIDFLPDERRLIRRDGIQLFKIFYWDNVLSPVAGRSNKPVVVKYDPRNLSRIYYQDGDGRYWTIPYRNLGATPISLWEHREAMKRLQAEGRKLVDERLLFDTVVEQRQLIQSAQKSTRLRRNEERRHQMQKTTTTTRTSDQLKDEPDYSDLLPYDVEEWS